MVPVPLSRELTEPLFLQQSEELSEYIQTLTVKELQKVMHISEKLAASVEDMYYDRENMTATAAVETFRGDIYSGLRALEWTDEQKSFAQTHLKILSGLYGVLRPFDGVQPYRLEAGYKLPSDEYRNLYHYWGDRIADSLPLQGSIVNVTSDEYAQLVLPFIEPSRIITPVFLTRKTAYSDPVFVVVHAKIARGAYARWLIIRGVATVDKLEDFNDLGYVYAAELSTPSQPVYVCDEFKGIGLSQRLV